MYMIFEQTDDHFSFKKKSFWKKNDVNKNFNLKYYNILKLFCKMFYSETR